jgi:hypothetical protein
LAVSRDRDDGGGDGGGDKSRDRDGWTPRPDPTLLTTQQLVREISALKEQLVREIDAQKEIVFTRLDGMDKAIELFNDNITRVPTDTDKQISHLRELHDEKFKSIATQFQERDIRSEQGARDNKAAIESALLAAKEQVSQQNQNSALSISKSEAASAKQFDQIAALLQTTTGALSDKIDDIKDRLTHLEGKGVGQNAATTTQRAAQTTQLASSNNAIAIVAIVIGGGIGVAGLIAALLK